MPIGIFQRCCQLQFYFYQPAQISTLLQRYGVEPVSIQYCLNVVYPLCLYLGVGNSTDHTELFNMASIPEDRYLYEFPNYDDLNNVTLDVNLVKCKRKFFFFFFFFAQRSSTYMKPAPEVIKNYHG